MARDLELERLVRLKSRWMFVLVGALYAMAGDAGTASESLSQPLAVVRTSEGLLVGIPGPIEKFFGIPFAAPPVGILRWRPPQRPQPWAGERDATHFGPDCMQVPLKHTRAAGTSEDCLTLNIWAPSSLGAKRLPVMIWVYGGGFTGGSGSLPEYDGESLAKMGVVVVTINYRVGVFGFLAHPALTRESPQHTSGNYGLLDQIAAIKWVDTNIAAFGGDKTRLTVFGESAGASSLSLLLASPLSRGLFDRVILESPGTMRPLSSLAEAERNGEIAGTDLSAMRAMSAQDLLTLNDKIVPRVRMLTSPRALGPIADGYVLPSDERAALREGRMAKVPLLIGGNADEGRRFIKDWPIKTVARFREYIGQNFGPDTPEALKLYPVTGDSDVPVALGHIFADAQFHQGIRGLARGMARQGAPTYLYLFTRGPGGKSPPPTHGDEIVYAFGNLDSCCPECNGEDRNVSLVMMNAWVRFATSGNPSRLGPTPWPMFQPAAGDYVQIDEPISVKSGYERERLDFFDRFYSKR